jgi:hypothetical protein
MNQNINPMNRRKDARVGSGNAKAILLTIKSIYATLQ